MRLETPTGVIRQVANLAQFGDLSSYVRQIQRLGGCERPIRMEGHRLDVHAATGEIVGEVVDHDLPAGQLLIRCNNRRATRCAACAEVYRKDTLHLVTAGLSGGKGIGLAVARHPRLFATFTAPSFGPSTTGPAVVAAAAAVSTPTTIRSSARPWTLSATTTAPPSCGTRTPVPCGLA